ncbi:MAG: glycerophosphoryl diester phosphodiesterase membrane domain-containing protein [Planctomycetia bacterium]|nr:glycerophosphoryl diester phosphodiesterase membrane domain-containing protein [Planctomycetia bacterium]
MKADFYCTDCGAHLQVEEQYRGQKIICPSCSSTQKVPGESPRTGSGLGSAGGDSAGPGATSSAQGQEPLSPPDSFAPLEPLSPPGQEGANPYQTPQGYATQMTQDQYGENELGLVRTPLKTMELVRKSLGLIFHNFGRIYLLLFVIFLVQATQSNVSIFLARTFNDDATGMVVNTAFGMTMGVIGGVVSFLFLHYMVLLATGSDGSWRTLFPSRISVFFRAVLAWILYTLLLIGMYVLCAIAGLVLSMFVTGLCRYLSSVFSDSMLMIVNVAQVVLISLIVIFMVITFFWVAFRYVFNLPFIIEKNVPVLKSFSLSNQFATGNFRPYALAAFILLGIPMVLFMIVYSLMVPLVAGIPGAAPPGPASLALVIASLVMSVLGCFLIWPLGVALYCTAYAQMTGRGGERLTSGSGEK